jgi:hypothetical protein
MVREEGASVVLKAQNVEIKAWFGDGFERMTSYE